MHDRLSWAQSACSRVLRPLVRLALGLGLKHPHLEGLLRNLLLEEALRLWQAQGVPHPNISQLAVTTGLNRKDVTQRVRHTGESLPHTEQSSVARTFTRWLQLAAKDPAYRRLPINASPLEPSFESVALQASHGDVHHRALLDELARLGMVTEHGEQVELTAQGFVPAQDLQTMLAFLGDNARDHLLAAVSNTLGQQPRMLERAVFAEGLTQEDCEAIERVARQRWETLHHELVDQMTHASKGGQKTGLKRMRVGIYTYYEDERLREHDPEPEKS
ncbi:MAG: hypothetical protein EPN61_08230 [Burkholderiaceae bacterium]|nr:MAG: hypothetical protein EPN61_08230 [Burkholderiaceae bacterium]